MKDFRFRHELQKSKCNTCTHAFIAEQYGAKGPTTLCKLLGINVQPIKSCNHWRSPLTAPLPQELLMHGFYPVDPKKHSGTKAGFGASNTLERPVDALEAAAELDPNDDAVAVISTDSDDED